MKRKIHKENFFFNAFNVVFWVIAVILCMLPIVFVFNVSVSDKISVNSGRVSLLPINFSLDAYKNIINDGQFMRSMKNSIVITLFGTLLSMLFTILCAYPLSKPNLKGRKVIIAFILFTMFFKGGMIPSVILVRQLDLMNTYFAVWLSSLTSIFNIFILKTAFESIPNSLEEAAKIDGANDVIILLKIYLRLSIPALLAVTLFYVVSWWNEYYMAMLFVHSSEKMPVVIKVQQMIENMGDNLLNLSGDEIEAKQKIAASSVKCAGIMLCMVPMLLLSLPMQKYYIKGNLVNINKE
jgi:putative aldouronate transport system permease protein